MKTLNKLTFNFLLLTVLFFPVFSLLPIHTVLLKQGRSIKGTVSSQNLDHVEVVTSEGKHVIVPKKSVLKIIYKDLAEEDEAKIRKAEETKREEEKQRLIEQHKLEILAKQEQEKRDNEISNQVAQSSDTVQKSTLRDSFVLGSPSSQQTITLANYAQKCEHYSEYPEYFWLFGAFRFKEPVLSELLPKNNKPIRITQRSTYKDIAFTLLGGFLITVTRKSLIVEVCDGTGYRLISEREVEQIKNGVASDFKKQQEIDSIQEKVDLELLEKDLKELESQKKKQK
ncbi:MAG: hypothetical protein O9264_11740 [Leptospira sp.]|jgi:hypothetical protein|nr:hypothetical protein [Leptospira sp.]